MFFPGSGEGEGNEVRKKGSGKSLVKMFLKSFIKNGMLVNMVRGFLICRVQEGSAPNSLRKFLKKNQT